MSDLARAIEIASTAHREQTRLDGSPYILHPLRLMFQLEGELQQMAAVLHDVVEDTEWTFENLRKEGFDEALIEALDCLTRREGESYKEFIDRLAPNTVARAVKIADLEDNMNLKQLERVTDYDLKRTAKYHKHWKRLVSMD